MASHIFIDTNIFLSFFHYTNDDLAELKKLSSAIKQKEVILYLPNFIISEFERNRERKIAEALKTFEENHKSGNAPVIVQSDPGFEKFQEAKKNFEKTKQNILLNIKRDATERDLLADHVISGIFQTANVIDSKPHIDDAIRRVTLGFPPGKNGSNGDAIAWLSLLNTVPSGTDLYIVSKDSDYKSDLDETRVKEFLLKEWKRKKGSKVFLYTDLSKFFRDRYPEINIANDPEKEFAINQLVQSPNFQTTHIAVSSLRGFTHFENDQAVRILEAMNENPQIHWIAEDRDVHQFVQDLFQKFSPLLSNEITTSIKEKYKIE